MLDAFIIHSIREQEERSAVGSRARLYAPAPIPNSSEDSSMPESEETDRGPIVIPIRPDWDEGEEEPDAA